MKDLVIKEIERLERAVKMYGESYNKAINEMKEMAEKNYCNSTYIEEMKRAIQNVDAYKQYLYETKQQITMLKNLTINKEKALCKKLFELEDQIRIIL